MPGWCLAQGHNDNRHLNNLLFVDLPKSFVLMTRFVFLHPLSEAYFFFQIRNLIAIKAQLKAMVKTKGFQSCTCLCLLPNMRAPDTQPVCLSLTHRKQPSVTCIHPDICLRLLWDVGGMLWMVSMDVQKCMDFNWGQN